MTRSPEIPPRPVVLVPLGSTEQHGPHLPLTTDLIVAEAVTTGIVEALGADALALPGIPYGSSGEHQAFAGTASIGAEALEHLLVELARSLREWAGAVLVVNGHGGNVPTLQRTVARLRAEQHRIAWVPCALPADSGLPADAHAGRTETSLLLHLRPDLVGPARPVGAVAPLAELLPAMQAGGVAAVSPNGVLGDATGASAAEGEAILAAMVRVALARTRAFLTAPDPTP